MTLIALMLRPWIVLIHNLRVEPRVLADDLLIIAHGREHEPAFAKVYAATYAFLHDMGALAAAAKPISKGISLDAARNGSISAREEPSSRPAPKRACLDSTFGD